MRWFVLISVLAVYLMAPAFAAEVTLYGPQQFRRERHEPVTAKETFPGVPGTANLTVEFDTNSKCRPDKSPASKSGRYA